MMGAATGGQAAVRRHYQEDNQSYRTSQLNQSLLDDPNASLNGKENSSRRVYFNKGDSLLLDEEFCEFLTPHLGNLTPNNNAGGVSLEHRNSKLRNSSAGQRANSPSGADNSVRRNTLIKDLPACGVLIGSGINGVN